MSAKKEDKKEEKPKDEPKKDGAEGAEGEVAAKPKSKKKLLILIVVGLLVVGGGVAGLVMSGVLGGEEGKKKTEKTEEESEEANGEEEEAANSDEEDGDHGEEVSEEEEAGDGHGKAEGGKEAKVAKPVFLDLPDIVANLSSPTPRPHFINLKLTLEISSRKDLANIEDNLPRIKDAFNSYLREIRKEDLEGSAGMYRLENELMLRLEKLFGEGKVKDILFREIIVQ